MGPRPSTSAGILTSARHPLKKASTELTLPRPRPSSVQAWGKARGPEGEEGAKSAPTGGTARSNATNSANNNGIMINNATNNAINIAKNIVNSNASNNAANYATNNAASNAAVNAASNAAVSGTGFIGRVRGSVQAGRDTSPSPKAPGLYSESDNKGRPSHKPGHSRPLDP